MRTLIIVALIALSVAGAAFLCSTRTLGSDGGQVIRLARAEAGLAAVIGEPPPVTTPGTPPPRTPVATGPETGQLAWLRGGLGGRLEPSATVTEVTTVVADRDRIWAAVAQPPSLVSLGGPDAGPGATISCAHTPVAAMVSGDTIYWVETRAARVAGVKHIPAAAAVDVLRAAPRTGGESRVLSIEQGRQSWRDGDLLGVSGDRFYWVQRGDKTVGRDSTQILSLPVGGTGADASGRRVEAQLAAAQSAVLWGDELWWTEPSREMDNASTACSAHRRPVSGGEAQYITDWLPPNGSLMGGAGGVYYVAPTGIWGVPATLRTPAELWSAGQTSITAATLDGGACYVAVTTGGLQGRATFIRRIPLRARAALQAVLRIL